MADHADDPKPAAYYEMDRSDFLDWVGGRHARVLEVGCGAGRSASWLRAHGADYLLGVEMNSTAAAVARDNFDVVLSEPIETALPQLTGPFDLVICADVLEHLVDPWTVLRELREIAGPAATLAVSIPNVRNFRVLWEIAFGGGFAYPLDGSYDAHSIFDTTHLRFFTRKNVTDMLGVAGWRPTRWGVPPRRRLARIRHSFDILTGGHANDWLTYQWYVVSHPSRAATRTPVASE